MIGLFFSLALAVLAGRAIGAENYLLLTLFITVPLVFGLAFRNLWLSLLSLFVFSVFYSPLKDIYDSLIVFLIIDILFAIILFAWACRQMASGKPLLPKTPLTKAFLVFYATVLALAFDPNTSFMQSLGGIRAWLQFTPLYFIGYTVVDSGAKIRKVLKLFLFLGVIAAGYGIAQYIIGPEKFIYYSPISEERHAMREHYYIGGGAGQPLEMEYRVYSLFTSAGAAGAFMAYFSIHALNAVLGKPQDRVLRGLGLVSLPLMLITLLLTASRLSWLIFLGLACILFYLRKPSIRMSIALVLIFTATMTALQLTEGRITERAQTLQDTELVEQRIQYSLLGGLQFALENPLGGGLGYGGGVYGRYAEVFAVPIGWSDSEIVRALLDMGWPGLLVLSNLLWKLLSALIGVVQEIKDPTLKSLAIGLALSSSTLLLGVPLGSALVPNIPHSLYYWFLLGALMKLPLLEEQKMRQDTYEDRLGRARR